MALGVEAAGVIKAVGADPSGFSVGDAVLCHPVPLRDQGTWAPFLIAPVGSLAHKPPEISWETAAIFPVPALTAEQVVGEALALHGEKRCSFNGAGGITGGLIVQLAALRGVDVLATAGPRSADRVRANGAREVLDYHDPTWPQRAKALASGSIDAIANAAPGGATAAMTALAGGGRLATITPDPPAPTRGISVTAVYVRSDGAQLERLTALLASRRLSMPTPRSCGLRSGRPCARPSRRGPRAQRGGHRKRHLTKLAEKTLTPPRSLEMTTITRIRTGVADHIGEYADAVAVSGSGTQIFVSGTPGVREDGSPARGLHRRSPAVLGQCRKSARQGRRQAHRHCLHAPMGHQP